MIYIIAVVVLVGVVGGVVLVKHLGSEQTGSGEQQENPQEEDDIGLKPAEDGDEDDAYIEFDEDSTGSGAGNGDSDEDTNTPDANENGDSGNGENGGEDEPLNDGSDGRLF